MGQFTEVVLAAALQQCRQWRDRHLIELPVAVNVSASCLVRPDFPQRVLDLVNRYELDPGTLTLEITESAIVGDSDDAAAALARLRQAGIRLSIDDFGTGYSTMAYLKDLPVHELKIDRSFIVDLLAGDGTAVIVRAVVDMAHSLGLLVVAEGIEDEQTWQAVGELGCDVGQGYLVSRPLPADDLAGWLLAADDPVAQPA